MSLSEIRVNTTKTRTGVGTITYTETGPVITGIATASNFKTGSTNVHSTGVELANINTGGSTATFGGPISGTTASFSGTVSIGGTLTYEDVTNIDSVGVITARNGIYLDKFIYHSGDLNTSFGFPNDATDTFVVNTNSTEKFRIASNGKIGIGTDNPNQPVSIASGRVSIDVNNDYYGVWADGSTTGENHISVGRWYNTGGGLKSGYTKYGINNLVLENNHPTANHTLIIQPNGQKVSIGTHISDGLVHIGQTSAGSVSADAGGDELVLESSGNTGLSILSPGTGESTIFFGNPGTNGQKDGYIRYYHESHSTTANRRSLVFITGGGDNERVRIDSSGRLFVNRTAQHASSSEKLSVNGMTSIQFNSTSTAGLYIFNEETTTSGDPIQPFIFLHDGSGIRSGLGVQRSTGLSVLNGQFGLSLRTGASGVGGTERLRIKSGGEVRIGDNTTTASTAGDDLVIEGSSDRGLSIIAGTSSSSNIYFGDSGDADIGRIAYQHNDNALDFSVNAGTTRVRIHQSGMYVYGNDNYFYGGTSGTNLNGDIKIRSSGTAVYQSLKFMSSDGSSQSQILGYGGGGILFRYSGTHVWAINSQGERLELTNTALSPREATTVLDLGTTGKRYRRTYTNAITVNTSNTNTNFCINGGSSAHVMTIRNTTGGNGNVGILFSTQDHSGGREKAAIYHRETHGQAHYGGDFTFCLANSTGSAGQVAPSDERMRVMRGGGISFKGETSNNNMLDYYEEGTFTPSYGGTHSNISGNQRHARYTRIGNLVFYSLEYYISGNNGSWSSGFELGGMPYASSLSELYCSPSIGVMYGPGGYAMDEDASGRCYHLGSQNKIYFKFGTSGVRHLWIQFFHRVEN